jgi:hypothetical protein
MNIANTVFFKFEKEPGYFCAMYVNYGSSVAQGTATYVIAHFFFEQTLT